MKKVSLIQMEATQGGGRCAAAMGAIFGFGAGISFVPTPLTVALGSVMVGVGVIGGYLCGDE